MARGNSLSLQIIEAVAERERTDPVELEPPLHSVIDPEALDSLFQSTSKRSRANGTIQFDYCGYTVQISSSGGVQLTDPATSPQADSQSATDSLKS
ncbi:hypothetical protein NGM15_15280 [Natronosalvus halobius]|nr:hypothetical protein NGM15_15280 [Natronosalvus halobius]